MMIMDFSFANIRKCLTNAQEMGRFTLSLQFHVIHQATVVSCLNAIKRANFESR